VILPATTINLRRLDMRVLKINDLPEKAMGTATPIAGWTGGAVARTRQEIISEGQSEQFRCNVVNFRVGATTGWHVHDCDQILVVTAGRGIVASETEEREITVGDVVHIKAGERHWHGARADSPMSHITVTAAGGTSKH
jgi:quercetin dioxygenase-like cupin family protein